MNKQFSNSSELFDIVLENKSDLYKKCHSLYECMSNLHSYSEFINEYIERKTKDNARFNDIFVYYFAMLYFLDILKNEDIIKTNDFMKHVVAASIDFKKQYSKIYSKHKEEFDRLLLEVLENQIRYLEELDKHIGGRSKGGDYYDFNQDEKEIEWTAEEPSLVQFLEERRDPLGYIMLGLPLAQENNQFQIYFDYKGKRMQKADTDIKKRIIEAVNKNSELKTYMYRHDRRPVFMSHYDPLEFWWWHLFNTKK